MIRSTGKILGGLLCVLALCAGVMTASATTMMYYGTQKLLTDCAFVVQGRVISSECAYHDDLHGGAHHEIYTFTTIEIDRAWGAANPGATIVIEEIGGRVGTRHSIVAGIPRFMVGDETLLFIERRPDRHLKTCGMFLGAFRVEQAAGEIHLTRPAVPRGTTVFPSEFSQELVAADEEGHFELGAFIDAMELQLIREGR